MVAITVSTNYSDVLPIVFEANKGFFKKWIFVTCPNDQSTIAYLSNKPEVIILFWDFKNNTRTFDKGGAIKHAQNYTYDNYPDDWYLLLDSDICITASFNAVRDLIQSRQLNEEAIYGIKDRFDFKRLSDVREMKNPYNYPNQGTIDGFFQLYRKKVCYENSQNASQCDHQFLSNFPERIFIQGVPCFHLGLSPHWDGNRQLGSDFILD